MKCIIELQNKPITWVTGIELPKHFTATYENIPYCQKCREPTIEKAYLEDEMGLFYTLKKKSKSIKDFRWNKIMLSSTKVWHAQCYEESPNNEVPKITHRVIIKT